MPFWRSELLERFALKRLGFSKVLSEVEIRLKKLKLLLLLLD